MPSPYVKKLATELGITQEEVEKYWDKAKALTVEELGTAEEDFGKQEYAYTTGIVKKMLGVSEDSLKPDDFLESELGADDFIETLVSGRFNIGNVTVTKQASDSDPDDIEKDDRESTDKEVADLGVIKDDDEEDPSNRTAESEVAEAEGDEDDDDEDEDEPEDDEDEDEDNEDEEVEEKATTKTAKCPNCGKKYPVATGYCVSCDSKVSESEDDDKSEEEIPAKSMDEMLDDIVSDKED